MKIVVMGGTGLIGSKLVTRLRERGHETLAASPDSGVNTVTGQGLAAAIEGASVVVDVSNSPSFDDAAVLEFFETSTHNLLAAESAAGVGHHVALSVVGAERLPDSGYLRAKVAQEKLIEDSPIPYTIVHATQFFEFVGRIADEATTGTTVRLAHVLIQPMAAEDVASALADVTVGPPVNGIIEVAGPQQFHLDDLVRSTLRKRHDPREVITDPHARYYGAELHERTLVPAGGAHLARTRFGDWLNLASELPADTLVSAVDNARRGVVTHITIKDERVAAIVSESTLAMAQLLAVLLTSENAASALPAVLPSAFPWASPIPVDELKMFAGELREAVVADSPERVERVLIDWQAVGEVRAGERST
jgi:uncharacterized protein YbjT (DUF2867 family)